MAGDDELTLACEPEGNGFLCHVRVGRDPRVTHHEVRVTRADLQRLAPGSTDPIDLVTVSFHYLLEREPHESILRSFDLPEIERYYPSFSRDIKELLA